MLKIYVYMHVTQWQSSIPQFQFLSVKHELQSLENCEVNSLTNSPEKKSYIAQKSVKRG